MIHVHFFSYPVHTSTTPGIDYPFPSRSRRLKKGYLNCKRLVSRYTGKRTSPTSPLRETAVVVNRYKDTRFPIIIIIIVYDTHFSVDTW